MWMVDSCKKLDTFNWSPKGYTIKSGNRAAYDKGIYAYPKNKDGYNKFFDKIPKIKNVKVKYKSVIKKINMNTKYII